MARKRGNNRLTQQQEEFCNLIVSGKTQYESYITAYPTSKKWTRNAIDVAAVHLLDKEHIKNRIAELRQKDIKQVMWTRQKALDTINYVMEMNRQDIERINEACQTEIDLYEAKLMQKGQEIANATNNPRLALQIAKEMQDITETIQKLRKQRRVNQTNIHGVYEGAKILNRMFGFDITKVEIKQEDEERNEMEKLTAEDLKELLKLSKKEIK